MKRLPGFLLALCIVPAVHATLRGEPRHIQPGSALTRCLSSADESWGKILRFPRDLSLGSIKPTGDGGALLLAYHYHPSNAHFIVIKVDDAGNIQWQKAPIFSCVEDPQSGGFAVIGYHNKNYFLAKLDSSGTVISQRTYSYSTPNRYFITSIKLVPEKGYLLVGNEVPNVGKRSTILLRVNLHGDILWFKRYPLNTFVWATTPEGYIYLSGNPGFTLMRLADDGTILRNLLIGSVSESPTSIVPTPDKNIVLVSIQSDERNEFFVTKMTPAGKILWRRSFQRSPGIDFPILTRVPGRFVVSGSVRDASRQFHASILKLDAQGRLLWTNSFGGASAFSVAAASSGNGKVIIGGTNDTLFSKERVIFLMKFPLKPEASRFCSFTNTLTDSFIQTNASAAVIQSSATAESLMANVRSSSYSVEEQDATEEDLCR